MLLPSKKLLISSAPCLRFISTTTRRQAAPFDAAVRRSMLKRKKTSFVTPEVMQQPGIRKPLSVERTMLGLAAGAGLGAVCFYGLMQKQDTTGSTIMTKSNVWPEFVRSRLRKTFVYLGGSIAITAGSALACFRSPSAMRLIMGSGRHPLMTLFAGYAAVIGTGMATQMVPYDNPSKHLLWFAHAGTLGAVLAPLLFLGGPILTQAAWYTAGLTGSLALVASCAPSHQFLNWSAPLSIGLGAVVLASIGSAFAGPPVGLLSAGLYSISTYGGLVVFSGLLLYDTQRIAHKAESLSPQLMYDPVNESISVFLDILNIFTRIAMILAGGGQGQRKQGRTNMGIGGRRR